MGWKDAPLVGKAAWEDAPLVEEKQNMLGVPAAIGKYSPPIPKDDTSSFIDKMIGAGETALTLGSSVFGGPYGQLVGLSAALRSGKMGTQEANRIADKVAQEAVAANTYAPRTEKGKEYVEGIATKLSDLIPIVGLPGETAAAVRGAKYAIPAVSEAKQAGTAKAAQVLREKMVDPEVARLARIAQDRGIPLRPDQLSKSKLAKATGTFFERDVPGAGGKSDARSTAFTKAWIDEIGGDSSSGKITGDVFDAAKTGAGERIGEIYSSTKLPDASGLLKRGEKLLHEARYSEQAERLVKTTLEDLRALVKDGGIDGAEFQKWNSSVLEKLRDRSLTNTGELSKLQKAAFAEFEKHVPAELRPDLNKARYQYALASRIEPAVAKAQNFAGELSPADVNQAVFRGRDAKRYIAKGKGGAPADLAAIGKTFVEEPGIKTSVAERYMLYRGLAALSPFGAGFLATGGSPAGAAAVGSGIYGLANLYNRLGPKVTRALTKAGETPPELPPAGFNPTLGWGAYASAVAPDAPRPGPLGDLVPDWTTTPGAGSQRPQGISARGLFPAIDEPPLVPDLSLTDYKPAPMSGMPGVRFSKEPVLEGMVPEWTTSQGFAPRQSGIDAAGLFKALGDERVGTSRLKGRPQMPMASGLLGVDDTAIAGQKWVDAAEGAPARMREAPMAVGGIELSRLINMPKSAKRTKLLKEFKERYPQAAEYIDQNM